MPSKPSQPSRTTQHTSGSSGKRRRGETSRAGSPAPSGSSTDSNGTPEGLSTTGEAAADAFGSAASASTSEPTTSKAAEPKAAKASTAKTSTAKSSTAKSSTAKASAAKASAAKGAGRAGASGKASGGRGPGGRGTIGGKGGSRGPGGGKGRRPVKPVQPGKPWGLIALGAVVVLVAAAIIGYGVWYSWDSGKPFGERNAQQIEGMVNYRKTDPDMLTRNHVAGKQTYEVSPPVGGDHNDKWENCEGDVYRLQIPNEHAVHSMEHGAVWITYRPDLPAADVAKLAEKVRGKDYMMMSPYPGLSAPISLQAWGFQLKVNSVDDDRIDTFITQFRRNGNVEPGATCSQGVTVTGTSPIDIPTQSGG